MKDRNESMVDGEGPSDYSYEIGNQEFSGPFCDTCWNEAVTEVNGVDLCRTHKEVYGVPS